MTLTAALALLGGVVLLALLLHGWWSTRRAQARQAAPVLAPAGERIEPALEAAAAAAGAAPDAGRDRDGESGPDTVPEGPPPVPRAPPWRVLRLDPLIDAIVPLVVDGPITGEAALAHQPATRRAGSKPFYLEGLDVDSGIWEPLTPGRRYGELQAGVQLASRSGALNEIEYSEFVQKIEAFAEAVSARAEPPEMLEVVARARELDALTSPLDAVLSVTLRSNAVAWSVAYVHQVAARHGFVPGAVPGRFVLPAVEEGAPPMLVLTVPAQAALADEAGAAPVRECTLALDVPQIAESAEPFPTFHRVATALAEDLDATATDDRGQTVTLGAYAAIGLEIERLYRGLEQLDLAAGSQAARRLFSG